MIEYRDEPNSPWKPSRFAWLPEDIEWLNSTVGWAMYRQTGDPS
ncbi:hypothetical protein [Microbacterium sp. H6]|nr:hypothetical protein [Microbacterium sp. H6]